MTIERIRLFLHVCCTFGDQNNLKMEPKIDQQSMQQQQQQQQKNEPHCSHTHVFAKTGLWLQRGPFCCNVALGGDRAREE